MNEPENSSSEIPPETPRPLLRPMPAWLIVLLTLFIYRGVLVVDQAGGFDARIYPPYTQPPRPPIPPNDPDGRILFSTYCAICHQSAGQGTDALGFPPLAGSDWVKANDPSRLIRIVLHGVQGPIVVSGREFNSSMPPWKDSLDDGEIAAILTFIRSSWGNSAPPVTAAEVKSVRDAEAHRPSAWTAEELLKLPAK
jgi:mono/diheme cytochrome c family protein